MSSPIGRFYSYFLVAALAVSLPAAAQRAAHPADNQVRQSIIADSIAAYRANGAPCACPYNSARNGSSCGRRSAYSRPGGAAPLCYPSDVTAGMVLDWRREHGG